MQHIFWLIPGQLAGRPGPTSKPWSSGDLSAAGFRAVLNLSEFEPDREELARAGIAVEWIPLPTTVPPDADTERTCLTALPEAGKFIDDNLGSERPVLVHCQGGRDRTALVLAHFSVRTDRLSPAAAIAKVREARSDALTAEGWADMAQRVLARLQEA